MTFSPCYFNQTIIVNSVISVAHHRDLNKKYLYIVILFPVLLWIQLLLMSRRNYLKSVDNMFVENIRVKFTFLIFSI